MAGLGALASAGLTVALSLDCDGDELLVFSVCTGVLAAVWTSGPAQAADEHGRLRRGRGARVALFVLVTFLVGIAVWVFTLMVYNGACR